MSVIDISMAVVADQADTHTMSNSTADRVLDAGEVFRRLEKELRDARKSGSAFLPPGAAARQIKFARTLWQCRAHADDSTGRFVERQELVICAMRELFDGLIAQGYMRAVKPNSTLKISRACWLVWLSWLRFEHMARPNFAEPSEEAIARGIALAAVIVRPYFTGSFMMQMDAELRKSLPQGVSGVCSGAWTAAAPHLFG